jgi:hypothetical protein
LPLFSKEGDNGLDQKIIYTHQRRVLINKPLPASLREARRAREGNTPLHPSQEGIYPLPWWPRARSQRLKEERVRVRGNIAVTAY